MIFLLILVFLSFLLNVHADLAINPDRVHNSDVLKIKCDSLLYRSVYYGMNCYFAITDAQDIESAKKTCSSILAGSRVASTVPDALWNTMWLKQSDFHQSSSSSGAKKVMCYFENPYKCARGENFVVSSQCAVISHNELRYKEAQEYCAKMNGSLPFIKNSVDNRQIGEATGASPAWLSLSRTGGKWSGQTSYAHYTPCISQLTSGIVLANEKKVCTSNMGAVISSSIDANGYWTFANQNEKQTTVCILEAESPFWKPAPVYQYVGKYIFGLEKTTCERVEVFDQTTSAYCPTTQYPKCMPTRLVEENSAIRCPDERAAIAYRNATALWIIANNITCDKGVIRDHRGKVITKLMRPTCAYRNPCDECPRLEDERVACPKGYNCTTKYTVRSKDPEDHCSRIRCTQGRLSLYAADKSEIDNRLLNSALYCTVLKKWHNYSLQGQITGGTRLDVVSVNCKKESCGACRTPPLITNSSFLPDSHKAVVARLNNDALIRTEDPFLCTKITCARGHTILVAAMGKPYTIDEKTIASGGITCGEMHGLWRNGNKYSGFIGSVRVACLRDE